MTSVKQVGKASQTFPPNRPARVPPKCGGCQQPATSVVTAYTARGPKPRLCCGHCTALAAAGLTATAAIGQGVRR